MTDSEHSTQLVAIINVTPDSFSDGALAFAPDKAIKHAAMLLQEGADILDIGAESTRPGATPLTSEQEWERLKDVLPPIIQIAKTYNTQVSVDTRHAETAAKALNAGVDWINDVSGFTDKAMIDVVKQSDCPLVVTHSLSIPANPSITLNSNSDVVSEIVTWFNQTRKNLVAQGIKEERLICDPGIGFGKSAAQSLTLISCAGQLKDKIKAPIFIGHSRKSFCNAFAGDDMSKRDVMTCAFSSMLMLYNIDYIRVHDIVSHIHLRDVLRGK